MATYLLTGATGFVGSRLARTLDQQGHTVRVFRRPGSDTRALTGVSYEDYAGALHDEDAVARAAEGCDGVFQVAGMVSYFEQDRASLVRVNVDGPVAVCRGARKAGVSRVVVTSSVAAIGFGPDGELTHEESPFNWPPGLPYMETKRDGERAALAEADDTLEVVAVNPPTVMGPGDWRGSMAPFIVPLATGLLPFYLPGGASLVDVDDLAAGHLLAMEKGRSGRRYILGGANLEHRESMALVCQALGVRAPVLPIPGTIMQLAGGALQMIEQTGLRLPVASRLLRLSGEYNYVSSLRAEEELGYRARPAEETAKRTVQWHREVGKI